MSTTAASISLPSPYVNRAFTTNSDHSRQHTQRKFQPKKKKYNKTFTGCSKYQADSESTVNLTKQLLHHDESTCICSDNATIRGKSVHKAVRQDNAKNPPQHSKSQRELDYKRKSPHLAVIPSQNANSVLINTIHPIQYP
eukprot:2322017-Ditylum_brightwellii.AAC.2